MKTFLKDNIVVWVWMCISIFIELFSITFANCAPYLTSPFYALLLLIMCAVILTLIKNQIAKSIVATVFIIAQIAMCVGFIYMYESNGTFFDFSMINMRDDARGTIEDLTFNALQLWVLVPLAICFVGFVVAYIVYRNKKGIKSESLSKNYKIVSGIVTGVLVAVLVIVPVYSGYVSSKQSYVEILYNQNYSKYQTVGITGNAVSEVLGGMFANKVDTSDIDKLDEYLYGAEGSNQADYLLKTSTYNGISRGNNLIMLMVESFDWYPLTWYDAETTKKLYPNITKLFGESLVLNNFYAREKTDTSENNAILGSNPTGKYMNYDFAENSYPYSLPNMFKEANSNAVVNAFHQNDETFYNRYKSHKSLGFEKFYGIESMKDFGVVNTFDEYDWGKGERTKDSETVKHMVQTMCPTDKQFFTYYLTFSMHGYYVEREGFKDFTYVDADGVEYENGYYGYLDALGVFPESDVKKANYLRTYAACVLDFDVALGYLLDYLEENNLLDTTTIVLYGDHNTYYNNLSYYAKGITETYNSELYRIPCIIYDKDLVTAYKANVGESGYSNVIGNDGSSAGKCLTLSKFTTTIDLIPTVLDLFGIKGWKNLYMGSSIFTEEESIIFSRAYGIFVTDKLVCYSINNLLYTCEGFTEEDKQDFIARAKVNLTKQEYIDKIFYSNYFKNYTYKPLVA